MMVQNKRKNLASAYTMVVDLDAIKHSVLPFGEIQ